MGGFFGKTATVIGVAVVAFLVYLHYGHRTRVTCTGCGLPFSVLVAKTLIHKGTPGDIIRTTTRYYKVAILRRSQIEDGAIVDPSTLAGKVALTNIHPSQQLTLREFGAATK